MNYRLIYKYIVLLITASGSLFPTVAARAAEQQIYRHGQPDVISPPPPNAPVAAMRADAARKVFAAAYAAQKRPGIALYWNRQMTDILAQDVSKVTDETDSSRESGTRLKSITTDEAGASSELSENDSTGKRTHQKVEQTVRSSGGTSTGAKLAQKMDITLRAIFIDFLRSANARVIDRTLMMRSSTIKNDSVDTQLVEMKGLEDNARFLVEVVVVPDSSSPLGCGFQINIKDIRSNEHLAELYTLATPPSQGPGKFTAVPGKGFERAQQAKPSVQDYGRQLGTEFLEKFASVL